MTETATAPALQPVRGDDRIVSLDLIRGLAVLGILAVNAMLFFWPHLIASNPTLQPGFDAGAGDGWQVMHVFFQDKMRTLFSMLFGVSIFLVGGERSDAGRGRLLRSRLFWLAVFGLIHGAAFWFGDILLLYAWSGLFVMLMRSWSARRLLTIGIAVNVICSALYVGMVALMGLTPPEKMGSFQSQMGWGDGAVAALARDVAAFQGDALSVTVHQFMGWLTTAPGMLVFFLPATIGLMLIGMGLFKSGFLAGRAPTWAYATAVGVGAVSLFLIWQETSAIRVADFPLVQTAMRPMNTFLAPLASLAYASALILLLKAGLRTVLHPLICAGRMAFTNYLTQTLIMTTIAYGGRGLGFYGEIGWPEMWQLIGAVWIVQLIWSPIWLHVFRMGPIEWVWRRLTYGRSLPLRRSAA